MKPMMIDLRRELFIWVVMLIGAIGVNIYAISLHNGDWSELWTQFHIVLIISLAFYAVVAVIRIIIAGIRALFKKTAPSDS